MVKEEQSSYIYDILLYILLQHVRAFSKPSSGNKYNERKIISIQHNAMFLFMQLASKL
jgi:hypothetical protein